MTSRGLRLLARGMVGIVVLAAVLAAGTGVAAAHPLGNASTNHHAGLIIGTDETRIDYVLDLAELPTLRVLQTVDADGDGSLSTSERAAFVDQRCDELAGGLTLTVAGAEASVVARSGQVELLDGAAGLRTLRLECDLRSTAGVDADDTRITFVDSNPATRGWREVTAVGDEVTFMESSVPDSSASERLAAYPDDAPLLDVTSAELQVSPGGAPAPAIGSTPFGERARAATDRFTSLVASDDITIPLVATSLVVAMLFGAFHSLAPGHGKSVIAAYLLGQQRDRRLAFALGGTVAITHTASVLVFGAIISITQTAAPEAFYPLFGVVSGLLFVALGVALLRQVVTRHRAVPPVQIVAPEPKVPAAVGAGGHVGIHDHDHDHDHDHGWHEHQHVDLGAVASGELGWRGVVLPGLAGGLVPSPSALLVFLGGLALGRAWFGIGLVLGYGVGIAATLVTAGWLLARAGDRFTDEGALAGFPRLARLATYLPAVTAVLVILGGLHIAVRAVV